MGRSAGSGRLWLALGLSPLLHIAAAVVVVAGISGVQPTESPETRDDLAANPPVVPEPEKPRVRLGIERSNAATITWIGFETPTPHSAPEADTEQPALTRDAPSPPPQVAQIHAEGTFSTEQNGSSPRPEEAEGEQPAAAMVTAEAAPRPVADPLTLAEALRDRATPIVEAVLKGLAAARPESTPVEEVREAERAGTEAATHAPAPASAAAPPVPREPTAEQSPRESDPFALEKPVVVHPGRPAAAEGLEIETRHLRLSLYSQVIAPPGRVRVLATFNRQGRVTDVEFVKRTGIAVIDEPILNCVFSWRARGRALEALDPMDPEAGLVVPFEIVLR